MKRIFYLLLLIIPLLVGAVQSQAMPPHPDLLKKWKEEGIPEKDLKKSVPARVSHMSAASSLKSTPSSGTVKVPVIPVAYRSAYSAKSPGIIKDGKPRDYGDTVMLLFVIIAGISLVGLRAPRLKKTCRLVYIITASSLLSCGDGTTTTGYTQREFPTDLSVYDTLLNSSSGSSVRKYYQDMSNNNLTMEFDVFDAVTVSREWSYYGANDVSGNDLHAGELVCEAVKLVISKNSSVDFSIYDNDHDSYVDSVIIIHEGPGEETGAPEQTIWSHQWDLDSAEYYGDGTGPVFTDGVYFNVYTVEPEYVASRGDSTIGVFCHELGHVLGLPDLYDTVYVPAENGPETNGAGNWSLMASGSWGGGDGSRPAPLLAWERFKVGGTTWVTINTISTTTSNNQINDIEVSRTANKIPLNDPAGQQYLVFEGKKAAVSTGWYVPGSGILITHIHEGIVSTYSSSNTVNSGGSRVHGVNIVEAGTNAEPGKLWTDAAYYGNAADLFYQENIFSLSTLTTPGTDYYTNTSLTSKTGDSKVSITGITSNSSFPMSFDVTIN